MLSLVRTISQEDTPKSEESQESDKSNKKWKVLPPGTPYLDTVNGRLVRARDKHTRTVSRALSPKENTFEKKPRRSSGMRNLFGDVFGAPTGESVRIHKHRRSASAAPSMYPPFLMDGVPHVIQPLSTPLPQQPFLPYYSVAPTPQLLQQPVFTFPAPAPAQIPKPETAPAPAKVKATEEEKEQLLGIDAHYQKVATKDLHRNTPDPATKSIAETTTKTTVTVTYHICAQCRRRRSSRYHIENPIRSGEEQAPAFCGKCQRDASITSSSGTDRDREKKKSKGNKKKVYKKNMSSPSEESYGSPIHRHRHQRSTSEQPRSRVGLKGTVYPRKHPQEHESEGFGSESFVRLPPSNKEVDADQPRSRGRPRQRGHEDSKLYHRDLSPIINQADSTYQRYEPVMHGAIRGESSHRRSPSPFYRYVEAPAYYDFPHRSSKEDIPNGFLAEQSLYNHVHGGGTPLRRKSKKISSRFFQDDQDGSSDSRGRSFYNVRSQNKIPSRSSREESRRPRPTERVVIKEIHHTSRTRPRHEAERRDDTVDRTSLNDRDRTQTFQERHEAAKYYNDDWGTTKPKLRHTSTGFRRDRYQDSELGPSEASYDKHAAFREIPRAPTPHSRAPSSAYERSRPPGYPFGSESDIASRKERRDKKGKAPQRYHTPDDNYPRRSSKARAYDERTDKSVILSPIHSRQTSRTYLARPKELYVERSWVDGADSETWTESDLHRWDERQDNVNPGDTFRDPEPRSGAWEPQHHRGASFESGYGEDLFR